MLNMGYDDPERSGHLEWVKLTPADYPMNEREHFTAANAEKTWPRTVWDGPYFEPVYKQILVSALTPVYVGDEQIATIGSDDLLGDLEARILPSTFRARATRCSARTAVSSSIRSTCPRVVASQQRLRHRRVR